MKHPHFLSLISCHDVIAISESKLDDTDAVDVPGHVAFYKNRGKFRRKSVGVQLLIKEELAQYVTVFESKDKKPKIDTRVKKHYCFISSDLCANLLFFKLSKKYVTCDILFGVVYIPPEGSPFENKDVFTELENSLLLLEHDGVCFLGDFNTRTGAVDGIITVGFNNDFDMLYKVFDDAPGSDKIPSALPKRISQDLDTNNYGFRLLDFCKTVGVAIVNGHAGSNTSIGKCTCKNVSGVDYALVSSDLFPLISGFAVLDFCELYSDVHCLIVLKLNVTEAQETEFGHFESDDDDCLEDADERNLQFITGKPAWCKTREDEYIFALDDAVINEINIVLDEELLSPSLDTINHIVLKITEL